MILGMAIVVVMLFTLLLSGLYVTFALAGTGIFALELLAHAGDVVGAIVYNTFTYALAAVPLFIFLGQIFLHGGLGTRLYRGVSQWTRIIPGGLTQSNILSCSIFAAISGSSVATAATIGTVAYPEQKKRGYSPSLVTASLAAGGTLGQLIPPSMVMIVYGSFVSVSVGHLFAGGVIPGVILASMFMTYIFFTAVINPSSGPPRERLTRRYFLEAIIALKDIWPMLLVIVLIMGSIYTGIMTPTEAAAASAFVALILAATFGNLNFDILKKSALGAVRTTAYAQVILVGGKILAYGLALIKVPALLSEMVVEAGLSPMMIWLVLIILYLILGCFMDGLTMMILTLPVTFPLMVNTMGFDPVWFGIMLVMLGECALITPPVGINLYIIQGISGVDLMTIVKGVIPFVLIILVGVALFTFVPELVLFLPSLM